MERTTKPPNRGSCPERTSATQEINCTSSRNPCDGLADPSETFVASWMGAHEQMHATFMILTNGFVCCGMCLGTYSPG